MGSSKADEIAAKKYFQPNGVLVNLLEIPDQESLEKAEAFYVELANKKGLSPLSKDISVEGLKQQHRELFDNLYEWAGSFRDYTTGRGLPFCRPEYIENELEKIYKSVNQKISFGVSEKVFAKAAAEFIGNLNAIHPFIDGNGRTQRNSLAFLAKKANYIIDVSTLKKESWYKAAELSHIKADYRLFEEIISQSLQKNKIILSKDKL